jgi:hypothetical protein
MRPLFPLVSFLILSVVPACVCSRNNEESVAAPPAEPSGQISPALTNLRRPSLAASLRPAINGRMPLIIQDGGIRPVRVPPGGAGQGAAGTGQGAAGEAP